MKVDYLKKSCQACCWNPHPTVTALLEPRPRWVMLRKMGYLCHKSFSLMKFFWLFRHLEPPAALYELWHQGPWDESPPPRLPHLGQQNEPHAVPVSCLLLSITKSCEQLGHTLSLTHNECIQKGSWGEGPVCGSTGWVSMSFDVSTHFQKGIIPVPWGRDRRVSGACWMPGSLWGQWEILPPRKK